MDSSRAISTPPRLSPPPSRVVLAEPVSRLLDRDHSIAALISPRRGRAVADPNGDYRKRGHLFWPCCVAIADDHQQVDRSALPLDERAEPDTQVRAASAVQLDLRRREDLPHVVHGRIAAGDDYFRAVPELTCEASQFGDGSRQLRILHRAGCVDEKPWPRPRLIEAGHDEFAVAGLPAMRPSVRAVISPERAVAQGSAHRVADGRHVVDLRRKRRPRPATPRKRDLPREG